ncbi:hypothetical protein ACLI1A_09135 [Flavobacterium sp. RHBU_3]|uniref:hypothetical protein n=1 Tax=Flavobacterium sp. RHBU_3 TaxID=3391184 RepID=UPI003984C84C
MKKIQKKRNYVLAGITLIALMASCSPPHRYGCSRRCRIPLSINEQQKPAQQRTVHS